MEDNNCKNIAEKSIHSGHRQRMREKFLRTGGSGFATHEILEMLLYSGNPRSDTNPLAHALIEKFGSFSGVLDASYYDLKMVEGVGTRNAFLLKLIPYSAGLYIADRCDNSNALRTVKEITDVFRSKYMDLIDELPSVLLLNASRRMIKWVPIGKGGKFSAQIDTKKLIYEAVQCNAAYVIMCHNHPSGDVYPSEKDVETTKFIKELLNTIDCKLTDHIILTNADSFSMASHNDGIFHPSKSSIN